MHPLRMTFSLFLLLGCLSLVLPQTKETAVVGLTPFKDANLGIAPSHEGHLLRERTATFDFGPQNYAIKYHACIDPVHEGRAVPLEGYIGMPMPSNCNWYHGGFLAIVINGQDIGTARMSSMTIPETGSRAILDMVWLHEVAHVRVRFMGLPGKDYLLCEIALDPQVPVDSISIQLKCYPSYFTSWNKRSGARNVLTPANLFPQIQNIKAPTADNWWAFYYDENFDVALGEGTGPCGLMLDPDEASEISFNVGDYVVETDISYPVETRRLHLAFWDFNSMKNTDAMVRMQEQAQVDLECMRDANFTPALLNNLDITAMQFDVEAALASPDISSQLGDKTLELKKWLEAPLEEIMADEHELSVVQEEQAIQAVSEYKDFMWDLKLAELLSEL